MKVGTYKEWVQGGVTAILLFFTHCGLSAELIAHWRLNETEPPYADTAQQGISMVHDDHTAFPLSGLGIEGTSARLHFQDNPGVASRIYANHPALEKESFGFSFWINPVSINPYDSLITKEMASISSTIPDDERWAWQVRVLDDDGNAEAPIELVVRGTDRSKGNFYGSVESVNTIPLYTGTPRWIHIAGGYDVRTGHLNLFVDGSETVSANSLPGADNSDGSSLAVGSVVNGSDFVTFAASTFMEDLQYYNGPLSAEEVDFLIDNPGEAVKPNFRVTDLHKDGSPDECRVRFNTTCGEAYVVQASAELPHFPYEIYYESSVNLVHDSDTATPTSGAGIHGNAVLLHFEDPPGIATRLFANNPAIQTDSFGFSFWIKPVNINPWDNFIAKEMAFDDTVPYWSRIAWQVHLQGDDGSGRAPVELVVRGAGRTEGSLFGLVVSQETLPLYGNGEWVHIAGGYDVLTGRLVLYINGEETVSSDSSPGAHSSDGSPLAVGSVRNGSDFIQYAATAWYDDIQVYDGPLTAQQISDLKDYPGSTVENGPHLTAHWRVNEPTSLYMDSAKAYSTGEVRITAEELENNLGTQARSKAFFRVYRIPGLSGF